MIRFHSKYPIKVILLLISLTLFSCVDHHECERVVETILAHPLQIDSVMANHPNIKYYYHSEWNKNDTLYQQQLKKYIKGLKNGYVVLYSGSFPVKQYYKEGTKIDAKTKFIEIEVKPKPEDSLSLFFWFSRKEDEWQLTNMWLKYDIDIDFGR